MSKKPAANGKDVVYVDVDDEITSIIDKVNGSDQKIVALVLPKRSTVLQSVVNMKLLKRSADNSNKNVVLVTTEAGLMPLAGAVGLHVAATPQSKPEIPHKPIPINEEPEQVKETDDSSVFGSRRGAAAGAAAAAAIASREPVEDTIQLDNEETPEAAPVGRAAAAAAGGKAAKPKKGKNKKLKVPNFNSFRARLFIGIGILLLLIVGFIFANNVLPKASVAIKTDSEDITTTLDVTFDTAAKVVDVDKVVVPSTVEQIQKTTTESVAASGEQNNGEKARGDVEFSLTNCSQSEVEIPAGTGISANGQTFITQEAASMQSVKVGNQCRNNQFRNLSSDTVSVVALKGGTVYNLSSGTKFTVNGYSSVSAESDGKISGGTDNIVKSVTQSDIDSAKQKLAAQVDEAVKGELTEKLEAKGLVVISESFNAGTPEVTVSAKVGDQVDSVTVTQKTTYSVVAAKKTDLDTLVTSAVEKEIDRDKQKVLNTGVDKAKFKLQNQQNNSAQVLMSMNTTSLVGPQLDDNELKNQIAGKKSAEAKSIITGYPGVTGVEIEYSPFWVSSIPSKTDKITITYEN